MQVVVVTLLLVCAATVVAEDYKNTIPIKVLDDILQKATPNISKELVKDIPASYGDCSADKKGPTPCSGKKNLYYKHSSWAYKVFARWVSGLKTLQITSMYANSTATGITMSMKGMFAKLPVSIYVGECFTFDQCSILWDNTYACCGSSKHFEIVADVKCGNLSHPIDSLSLGSITLDKLEITEKIVGIQINVKDVTGAISDAIKGELVKYLTVGEFLPGKNGSKVTLRDYLNHELILRGVFDLLCLKGDAMPSKEILV